MRAVLGLLGLLIALAVTGFLVRQQLKATQTALPVLPDVQQSGEVGAGSTEATTQPAAATPSQTSQQVQQQFKQSLDNAMKARPMPDDQP